jgi:hypothetical protein
VVCGGGLYEDIDSAKQCDELHIDQSVVATFTLRPLVAKGEQT